MTNAQSRIQDAFMEEAGIAGVSVSEQEAEVLNTSYVDLGREQRTRFRQQMVPRMLVFSLLVVAVVARQGQDWVRKAYEVEVPTMPGKREAIIHMIVRMVSRRRFEWNYGGFGPLAVFVGTVALVAAFFTPSWFWLPLAALAVLLVFHSVIVNATGRQRVRSSEDFAKVVAHVKSLGVTNLVIR